MAKGRTSPKTASASRPPVDIEQWLDFIIAAASHRSRDEAQKAFGEKLIHKYIVELPKEYASDPIAKAYLDNMLCAVAAAIRGFSVVRDVFQTNWNRLLQDRDRERQRAERLDAFSPFKKDGYWKMAFGIIGGTGLMSIALGGLKDWIGDSPWIVALALGVLGIALIFALELFIDWLRHRRMAQAESRFPENLLSYWQDRALSDYRIIARQFLLLAIRIREEHYPGLSTFPEGRVYNRYPVPHIDVGIRGRSNANHSMQELEDRVSEIVDRHFSFKSHPTK